MISKQNPELHKKKIIYDNQIGSFQGREILHLFPQLHIYNCYWRVGYSPCGVQVLGISSKELNEAQK